jgi:hypothetical protein
VDKAVDNMFGIPSRRWKIWPFINLIEREARCADVMQALANVIDMS